MLPVGAYTEFYWTVNARSLMNFCWLRPTKRLSARSGATRCGRAFLGEHMPVTHAAFVANGRVAP